MTGKDSEGLDCSREQLLYGHASHLSNFDLLTLLLNQESAARAVLSAYPTLRELEGASPAELLALPAMDTTSVVRLIAIKELSRRRALEQGRRGTAILDSEAAYTVLEPYFRQETREVVLVLALDTKQRLLAPPITISIGTIDRVLVHPREVFRPLIRLAASSCILAHFHPSSGEPTPSVDDLELTSRLREAGQLLGIPVHDHLVIGQGCFVSLADRTLM